MIDDMIVSCVTMYQCDCDCGLWWYIVIVYSWLSLWCIYHMITQLPDQSVINGLYDLCRWSYLCLYVTVFIVCMISVMIYIIWLWTVLFDDAMICDMVCRRGDNTCRLCDDSTRDRTHTQQLYMMIMIWLWTVNGMMICTMMYDISPYNA